jgi:hypothetical protein
VTVSPSDKNLRIEEFNGKPVRLWTPQTLILKGNFNDGFSEKILKP